MYIPSWGPPQPRPLRAYSFNYFEPFRVEGSLDNIITSIVPNSLVGKRPGARDMTILGSHVGSHVGDNVSYYWWLFHNSVARLSPGLMFNVWLLQCGWQIPFCEYHELLRRKSTRGSPLTSYWPLVDLILTSYWSHIHLLVISCWNLILLLVSYSHLSQLWLTSYWLIIDLLVTSHQPLIDFLFTS